MVTKGLNTYSIQALAKTSGISAESLRNWEKRYGILQPRRSDSGQRVYSAADVATVQQIASLLKAGARIGDLCRVLASGEALPNIAEPSARVPRENCARQLLESLRALQSERSHELASLFATMLSPDELVLQVYAPLLTLAGSEWQNGQLSIVQSNFVAAFARHRLHAFAALSSARRTKLEFVLATQSGERHEGGILALNALLRLRGHSTIYLGPDVPLRELRALDRSMNVAALCLSFTSQLSGDGELTKLKGFHNLVVVGGLGTNSLPAASSNPGVCVLSSNGADAVTALEALCHRNVKK